MIRRLKEFGRTSNNYFITAYGEEAMCPSTETEKKLVLLTLALEALMLKVHPNWKRRQLLLAVGHC